MTYSVSNNTIPNPPTNPEIAIKGYNVNGYLDLIKCISTTEQVNLGLAFNKVSDHAVNEMAQKIHTGEILSNRDTIRESTVLALKALQTGLVDVEQIASLYMNDAAVSDLMTNMYCFMKHKFVEGNELFNTWNIFPVRTKSLPTSFSRYGYNIIPCPDGDTISSLDEKFKIPLLKKFLNLNDKEWEQFHKKMEAVKHPSEKIYSVFVLPEFGTWSALVEKVQTTIQCFQNQSMLSKHKTGYIEEKVYVIPSFSMVQAYIDIKAQSQNRKAPKLLPMFGMPDETLYTRLKASGFVPISFYFPEHSSVDRYNLSNTLFKKMIDGWAAEGPLASIIHDIYHAIRELQMTDPISDARFRLSTIARFHPKNITTTNPRTISEILGDGELICCYSPNPTSAYRHLWAEGFGDIFYTSDIRDHLHPDLKRDFIEDMVKHAQEWRTEFNLGREDLRENDKTIYDLLMETD